MAEQKSNELIALEITLVKDRLLSIEKKLDDKYVSHETFDLVISGLRNSMHDIAKTFSEADSRIVKAAMFFAIPIYGAVVTLLFKLFAN